MSIETLGGLYDTERYSVPVVSGDRCHVVIIDTRYGFNLRELHLLNWTDIILLASINMDSNYQPSELPTLQLLVN